MTTVSHAPVSAEQRTALQKLAETWAEAAPRQDWDTILDLCTDDVVFMPQDEPIVEGKEDQRTWHENFHTVQEMKSDFVKGEVSGDTAIGQGVFSLVAKSEEGSLVDMKGKWLSGYRRQPDGRWLISHLAWNLDRPAA